MLSATLFSPQGPAKPDVVSIVEKRCLPAAKTAGAPDAMFTGGGDRRRSRRIFHTFGPILHIY
jgi:hypothetical protein